MMTRQIIFFSLVSVILGALFRRAGRRILAKGKLTEATIVENVYHPNKYALNQHDDGIHNDEAGTYYPVIHFTTDQDELIAKQLDTGANLPRSVGQKLPVVYNPGDPSDIVTYPRLKLEVIPRLLMTLGAIGLIVVVLDAFDIVSVIPN
ncbi:DUF3592 domain-containing protein [Parachryseolinea silvisoli]|uniref:DUF3592 domain-containing protein n=1 Tax=Parachryseolinea silvisoli TaxID=2873601 RepID=UPI002265CFA3|nr:DUF3592 domain-containing protein [Parachryseolinea silvisoli]MCD9014426.1 DUF3592 domain-containing protein [Parachryseolinea silvisoli]